MLLSIVARVLGARNWYNQGKGNNLTSSAKTTHDVETMGPSKGYRVCQESGLKGFVITVLIVE